MYQHMHIDKTCLCSIW